MASFSGDINELFSKAFGIYTQVPLYFLGDSKAEKKPAPLKGLRSYNGSSLFDRFGFQISEAGLTFSGPDEAKVKGAEVWNLPEASVVSRYRAKNIVRTIMPGRDGTVKELIGMDDWEFVFRGFIINHSKSSELNRPGKQIHQYPREGVQQMEKVFSVNKSMRIYSRLINDLDVHRVVITSLEFPALEGYDNVQPYELRCLSDDDIVLDLNT